MKVSVYWNRHERLWSVRVAGVVVGHQPRLTVSDARFVVRESGRRRCLREGKRNVHAWVEGTWTRTVPEAEGVVPVRYNPFDCDTFVGPAGAVASAARVWFRPDGKVVALCS